MFHEAFADRAYLPDGSLVPRLEEESVIEDPEEIVERALRLALKGEVLAIDGTVVTLTPHSLCLHGDTPGSVEVAAAVRAALEEAGVELEPFA